MRGKHKHYIEIVNRWTEPYYEPCSRKRVRTTKRLVYQLPDGSVYEVDAGTKTDLFSGVPDTGYLEFHKAAILHDQLRDHPDYSRYYADFCFDVEMKRRIALIRTRLLDAGCPKKVVDKEVIRLCRLAAIYLIGVSGLVGSLYIKLDRWF